MKGFYGGGAHDSKVEDYDKYKKKQIKSHKDTLNTQIDNIASSSLTDNDKVLLLLDLKIVIDKRITKKIN